MLIVLTNQRKAVLKCNRLMIDEASIASDGKQTSKWKQFPIFTLFS